MISQVIQNTLHLIYNSHFFSELAGGVVVVVVGGVFSPKTQSELWESEKQKKHLLKDAHLDAA